jgi:3D (Asp-Asp-Asp) domain-containing protein/peptidoglycan hydrolase-like protein with peptidoglycan-binding domain
MKKYSFKSLGISTVAAGAILFAGGNAASADENAELGEQLLFEGKDHSHVAELNELLAEQDYLDTDVDSTYTSETTEAVRSFQEDNNLLVDGLAGIQTIGAAAELSKGDTGYLVEDLQEKLASLGYYDYKVDGVFGPITEDAVASFQDEYDIEADSGVAGPQMYAQLYYSAEVVENGSSEDVEAPEDVEEPVEEETASEDSEASAEEETASEEEAVSEEETVSEEDEAAEQAAAEEEAAEQAAAEEEAAAEAAAAEEEAEQAAAEEEAAAEAAAEEEAAEQAAAEEEAAAEEAAAEEEAEQAAAEEEAAAEEAVEEEEDVQSTSSEPEGETLNVEATAYTAFCNGCSGVTATGIDLRSNPNQKVIAVDPNVIPLGSTVHVEGYGTAVAGDTGGAIKGNKIDLFMPERSDAVNFGRQNLEVTIVDTP